MEVREAGGPGRAKEVWLFGAGGGGGEVLLCGRGRRRQRGLGGGRRGGRDHREGLWSFTRGGVSSPPPPSPPDLPFYTSFQPPTF